jgi:tetratricopeptide (TPR) repeat protein
MRTFVLWCGGVSVLLTGISRVDAQMCQRRGGGMPMRGYPSYAFNTPFYTPTYNYPNYYGNSYSGSYANNYANPYAVGSDSLGTGAAARDGRTKPKLAATAKSKPRVSNAELRAKSEKNIAAGDEHCGNERYAAAVEQYKTAGRIAPDVAEPQLRLGFALVAQKRYAAAVKAFRRGLEIDHDWTDAPFGLGQIYTQAALARTIQTLSEAVEAKPKDSDATVALGMQLLFDGKRDQAGAYFQRAASLGADKDGLFDHFLPQQALAEAPGRNR